MDVERIIDEIEQLQEMFEAPDIRPLSASDISAANRRHDEMLAHSPWFRLWQRYGVCCRGESPVLRRLSLRTNSSTNTVEVAILKDRFGKASLRYAQHGATYAFGRRHVVREKHLPQRIEGSHQSVSHSVPSGLGANAVKRLNVGGAKQEHSLERHLQ